MAAQPALVVAEEPKGDTHDGFIYATSEPLSGWVAISFTCSGPAIQFLRAGGSPLGRLPPSVPVDYLLCPGAEADLPWSAPELPWSAPELPWSAPAFV
jgi:hypothetical protein